ncbi:unnamed protein product, partial [Anisakis simplex]
MSGIRPLQRTKLPIAKPYFDPATTSTDSNPESFHPHRKNLYTPNHPTLNTVASGSFRRHLLSTLADKLSNLDTLSSRHHHHHHHSKDDETLQPSISHRIPHVVTPGLSPVPFITEPSESHHMPVRVKPLRASSKHQGHHEHSSRFTQAGVRTETLNHDGHKNRGEMTIEEEAAKRRARLQARWHKLGPRIKKLNFAYRRRQQLRQQYMKERKQKQTTETEGDNKVDLVSESVRKIIRERLRQLSSKSHIPKGSSHHLSGPILASTNENEEEQSRKQEALEFVNLVKSIGKEILRNETTSTARITTTLETTTEMPATTTVPIVPEAEILPPITIQQPEPSSTEDAEASETTPISAEETENPVTETTPEDYHFRTIAPVKKYKFTQKLRPRPRLRIRRPGEKPQIRGNRTSSSNRPLSLPLLTPFGSESFSDRLPSIHREPFASRRSQPSHESENSVAIGSGIQEFESGVGGGDNALGFGGGFGSGGFGKPPVDFSSGGTFGLAGTGVNIATELPPQILPPTPDMTAAITMESTSTQPPTTTTPTATTTDVIFPPLPPPPPKEEVLVIPQNSGLRAVAPPVDFEGGFGSSSHGSSPDLFGSGSGGSGLIPSGSSGNVDESMFTGESALTPNRNGPTGDGFGPPLFPGAAVPPPVPAIGLGGDAAGLSPYRLDPDHLKNPPTTVRIRTSTIIIGGVHCFGFSFDVSDGFDFQVKPSALLSMLSKADIGFNQAINHFEQGTPLESAAIDILEVNFT